MLKKLKGEKTYLINSLVFFAMFIFTSALLYHSINDLNRVLFNIVSSVSSKSMILDSKFIKEESDSYVFDINYFYLKNNKSYKMRYTLGKKGAPESDLEEIKPIILSDGSKLISDKKSDLKGEIIESDISDPYPIGKRLMSRIGFGVQILSFIASIIGLIYFLPLYVYSIVRERKQDTLCEKQQNQ